MKEKIKNFVKKVKPFDLIAFPLVIGLVIYSICKMPDILIWLFIGILFYYVANRLK